VEVNLASLLLRKFWFQINGVARRRVTESWNEEKAVSKRVMMEASREDKIEVWVRSTKKEVPRVEKERLGNTSLATRTRAQFLSSSGSLRNLCALSGGTQRTYWTCHGLEARYASLETGFCLYLSLVCMTCSHKRSSSHGVV
jgi:hypothetical protein